MTVSPALAAFLAERHLATLTTLRPDGSPHVAPVGFTWSAGEGVARIITWASAAKVRHLRASGGARVALCQVDGRRWVTLEGMAVVTDDPERVAEAVRRYAERYRQPRENPLRVVLVLEVDRILGRG